MKKCKTKKIKVKKYFSGGGMMGAAGGSMMGGMGSMIGGASGGTGMGMGNIMNMGSMFQNMGGGMAGKTQPAAPVQPDSTTGPAARVARYDSTTGEAIRNPQVNTGKGQRSMKEKMGKASGDNGQGFDMNGLMGGGDPFDAVGSTVEKNFVHQDDMKTGAKVGYNAAMGVADVASNIPVPVVSWIGKALKVAIPAATAIAQKVKRDKIDERANEVYTPSYDKATSLNFGSSVAKFGTPLSAPMSNNKVKHIGGKSHEQGGTPIMTQGGMVEAEKGEAMTGDYIFSDSLGYDKRGMLTADMKKIKTTFADKAKAIEAKYKGKDKDRIAQASKKFELDNLKQENETVRVQVEPKPKMGTMDMPMAQDGLNLKPQIVPPRPVTKKPGIPDAPSSEYILNIDPNRKIINPAPQPVPTPKQTKQITIPKLPSINIPTRVVDPNKKPGIPDNPKQGADLPGLSSTVRVTNPRPPIPKTPVQSEKSKQTIQEVKSFFGSLSPGKVLESLTNPLGFWGRNYTGLAIEEYKDYRANNAAEQTPSGQTSRSVATTPAPAAATPTRTAATQTPPAPARTAAMPGATPKAKSTVAAKKTTGSFDEKLKLFQQDFLNSYPDWKTADGKTMKVDGYDGPITQAGMKYLDGINPSIKDLPVKSIIKDPELKTSIAPRFKTRSEEEKDMMNVYWNEDGTKKDMGSETKTVDDTKKGKSFLGDMTTGDKMQLASMLPATLYNLTQGLKKAEKEPIFYNKEKANTLAEINKIKFDDTAYRNQMTRDTEAMKQNISNNSTSVGVQMANLANMYGSQIAGNEKISTAMNDMENQRKGKKADALNSFGQQDAQAAAMSRDNSLKNKAAKQAFMAAAMTNLGEGINRTGQGMNARDMNKLGLGLINEMTANYGYGNLNEMLEAIKNNTFKLNYTEDKQAAAKAKQEAKKNKDNNKKG